jgi:tRNA A37 threonylcarbamoyladenosine biosynthesis protein TsaE
MGELGAGKTVLAKGLVRDLVLKRNYQSYLYLFKNIVLKKIT